MNISSYFSLVKFSHTIFAMPFALIGFTYALISTGTAFDWILFLQVVLCMVFARNVAMGFNRWADRDIDKANPRTADRDIPSGRITPNNALIFVIVNALLFIITASTINIMTAAMSPVALAVVVGYSYCKRFTSLAHLVLGLALSIAPAGAYIAVTGTLTLAPCILALVVLTWCSGFDIIYALQDCDFDRTRGLHSIPAKFSARTALGISIALHIVSCLALIVFARLYCVNSWLLWAGVVLFCAILALEHILVTPTRQRTIGIAFGTLNALASMTLAVCTISSMLIFG